VKELIRGMDLSKSPLILHAFGFNELLVECQERCAQLLQVIENGRRACVLVLHYLHYTTLCHQLASPTSYLRLRITVLSIRGTVNAAIV
jgi:hypothetical protein